MSTKLKDNLKKYMKITGWKAKTLAREAGLNEYVVHNILRGYSRKPSADKVEALARKLGTTTENLLYGNPEKPADKPSFADEGVWDGVLYAESMNIVKNLCESKKVNLGSQYRIKLMNYARRVYLYAMRKDEREPDPTFAEMIIDEAIANDN